MGKADRRYSIKMRRRRRHEKTKARRIRRRVQKVVAANPLQKEATQTSLSTPETAGEPT